MSFKASGSSVDKGESLKDTAITLGAYDPDVIVIRHAEIGAPALVARWTNVARELVDAPPNVATPGGLAERAAAIGGLQVEALDPVSAGLTALAAVGGSSSVEPALIVLRHEPPDVPASPRLALVGKAVTFDAGGYFLKPQADIIRQKGDMAGGAAVLAALGAIAELGVPVPVMGVLAACENMLGADAMRPSDVITTAAGLTVEVTNPDAEGRLILADAIWYARGQGVTHIVDLATLTGAMRSGMGDLYGGVFANDDAWRAAVVDAGNAASACSSSSVRVSPTCLPEQSARRWAEVLVVTAVARARWP
jgi:leucyl aminopeptidase